MDGLDISMAIAAGRDIADRPQTQLSVGNFDLGRSDINEAMQPRPIVSVRARRTMTANRFPLAEQISATAVRLRSLMAGNAAAVLHITSAAGGEGVSTVARELVHATAQMQWCKTLLLDANAGSNDQSGALLGTLPDIITGYAERRTIEVVAVDADGCEFHAARWPSNVSPESMATVPVLGRLLHAAYDLIVVDCPPIFVHPHLPTITGSTPLVLLVVRSEESSLQSVQRAKQEIESLKGSVWGAILTGQRRIVPRKFDRRF